MRTFRLTFLALLASFVLAACTSPTAYDDCPEEAESCEFGHPGSGS
jgi:outer membrane biogenesis lipoprotein LolB